MRRTLLALSIAAINLAPFAAHMTQAALTFTPGPRLTAPAGQSVEAFGKRVALGGSLLAVGAPATSSGKGAVYLYRRDGTAWTAVQQIQAPQADDRSFGASIAISGNLLAIGAPLADGGKGAIYIYRLDGAAWVQERRVVSMDLAAGDRLGSAVDLSGDMLVAGAPERTEGGKFQSGAAYVFARSNGLWFQVQKLAPPEYQLGVKYGAAVAIDGTVAAVATSALTAGDRAAVTVFEQSNAIWSLRQQLVQLVNNDELRTFGAALDLDSGVLAVGAPEENASSPANAVYLYTRGQSGWGVQQRIEGPDGAATGFGWDVDLDGVRLAVAAINGTAEHVGLGYVYERENGTWAMSQRLTPAGDEIWADSSIATSGGAVAVGAPLNGDPATGTVQTYFGQSQAAAPTISAIADQRIQQGQALGPIAFTIGDGDTPLGQLQLSATSSNTGLLPGANIIFGGSGASRTVTLQPVAGASGITQVEIQVSDGVSVARSRFSLEVVAPAAAPTISPVADRSLQLGQVIGPVEFTVGDADTPLSSLTVTAESDNAELLPTSSLVVGGSGAERTVVVAPAAGKTGTARVTLRVSDGALSASTSFSVQVYAPPPPPTGNGVISPEEGGTLDLPALGIRLTLPAGAVSQTVIISATNSQPMVPSHVSLVRTAWLWARTMQGAPVQSFLKPFTLTWSYTDEELALWGRQESSLRLLGFNGVTSGWDNMLSCAGCGIDTAANRVTLVSDRLLESNGTGRSFLILAADRVTGVLPVTPAQGGKLEVDGGRLVVEVPAAAVGEITAFRHQARTQPGAPLPAGVTARYTFGLVAQGVSGQMLARTLKPFSISLATAAGAAATGEGTLDLLYFDAAKGAWESVPSSLEGGRAIASSDRLGEYALVSRAPTSTTYRIYLPMVVSGRP